MQRILMLAAALALLIASPALAAKGGPPYKLDVKGKCHDSSGALAVQSLCGKPTPATPAATHTPAPMVATHAAATPAVTHAPMSPVAVHHASTGMPHCNPGNKPCGHSCISNAKTCHV